VRLGAFLSEISELSKKKPNDPLNKFKLKFINSVLESLNKLVGKHRPFNDFESFALDDIPTNSDVGVILAQYATATYNLRRDHTNSSGIYWYWTIRGKTSELKTERPEHFKHHPK
jgi:hypothetical protein